MPDAFGPPTAVSSRILRNSLAAIGTIEQLPRSMLAVSKSPVVGNRSTTFDCSTAIVKKALITRLEREQMIRRMMSSNRTDSIPTRSGAKSRRPAQHKRRNVVVACLSVLGGIGLLAGAASSVQWHAAPNSDQEVKSANVAMPQTGTVVMQSDTMRCEVAKFDNQTGQSVEGFKPSCSNAVVLDSHGIPVPTGTIHRLDSISKSFSGSKN